MKPLGNIKVFIKTLNNEIVKAVPKWGGEDTRPVLGASIFPEPFANIFLCAKKKSGKTSTIGYILKKCVGRNTKVIIFCSTIHKDASWKFIVKFLESKGIDVETHTSLKEDGVDLLDELVKDLENEAEDEDADDELDPAEMLKQQGFGYAKAIYEYNRQEGDGKQRKPKKPKYLAPDYIIILDDLSTELKSKSLVSLLKKNRHFKAKIIISSQYYLDLLPESRKQIDYFLLFKGQTEEKLQAIYKDADISIDYGMFLDLYKKATEKPFSFLYVSTRDDEFRISFSKKFEL